MLYDLKQVWLSAIFMHLFTSSAIGQIMQRWTYNSEAYNPDAIFEFYFWWNEIKTWSYTYAFIHTPTNMTKQ